MDNYKIRKVSNGELRRKERILDLNVDKYCSHRGTLYFDVEGEKDPYCFDAQVFYVNMITLIQQGLVESIIYDDGLLNVFVRDGNVYTDYLYDFHFDKFNQHVSALEELKLMVLKIVSYYNDNPVKSAITTQKYLRMIMDIIDGDRLPEIEDQNMLLRIFEVYNANKKNILLTLLQQVDFVDENDNILEYSKFLRAKKLMKIKYQVFQQMELAMIIFATQNNALDLYREYMSDIYIQPRTVIYKVLDENGNLVDPPAPQKTTAGTFGSFAKSLVQAGYADLREKVAKRLEKNGEKRRAK